MSCPEIYDGGDDLTGLLTSFESTHSMYGDYSASATFENPSCDLSINSIGASCIPVYGTIGAIATGLTDVLTEEQLQDCYEQNPRWIAGLVTSFGETQDTVSDKVDIQISSYFHRLASKPITSYHFSSDTENALEQLITYFAGIPEELYSYVVTPNPILGSLSSGSVMDAIKTVAQASFSSAYIQVGGILEVTQWKDHNSTVELTIPSQLIGPMSKRANNLVPHLAILSRGASIDTAGCGERLISDSRVSDEPGGVSNVPGPSKHIALSGIDTKEVNAVMAQLTADRKDLQDAMMVHDPNLKIQKGEAKDGNLKFKIQLDDVDGVIGPNGQEGNIGVATAWKQSREARRQAAKEARNQRLELAKLKNDQLAFQKRLAELFSDKVNFFPKSSIGGPAGGPGSKMVNLSDINSNQTTNNQLEAFAYNNSIGTECGASYEQIENPIVPSRDVLFLIAVRRHQEMLMDNNSFNIEIGGYLPCLRLNQVIQFDTPGTRDCSPRTVKALVTEIKTNYSADKQVSQSIVAADLDVLGQTTYTSSNLLDFQCGGGANAITGNPWEASALSIDNSVVVADNVITLWGKSPTPLVYAYLTQYLQLGSQYTLTFDYEAKIGSSPLIFDNTAGGGATIPGPVGSYTETFTAALSVANFRWRIISPSAKSLWRIYNLRLTRTVIA